LVAKSPAANISPPYSEREQVQQYLIIIDRKMEEWNKQNDDIRLPLEKNGKLVVAKK
jgi:hypothetical protein